MKSLLLICLCWMLLAASPYQQEAAPSGLKGLDVSQPIDIEADRLEVNDKDGTAQLIGNVRVIQGAMTLSTNSLMIYFEREKGLENPEIKRIDALETIQVESNTETVTGSWGVYDVTKRIITIGGDVSLKRADAAVKGNLLQINLVDGVTTLDANPLDQSDGGRVRGRFLAPPIKN